MKDEDFAYVSSLHGVKHQKKVDLLLIVEFHLFVLLFSFISSVDIGNVWYIRSNFLLFVWNLLDNR
jgi:hypothetical protein